MSPEDRPETQLNKDSRLRRLGNSLERNSNRIIHAGLVGAAWTFGGLNIYRFSPAFAANYWAGENEKALYYGTIFLVSFSGPAVLSFLDMYSSFISQNEQDRRERRNQFR